MEPTEKSLKPSVRVPAAEAGIREAPLLSIGLPVFNGARHLRRALDSLLAQDVEDLELIISDNASTDETADICAAYAAADSRVMYSRNDTNRGAAANFNRVFELSRGEYFMWASHDDYWDPCFARACIDALGDWPGAVQAISEVDFFLDNGEPAEYESRSIDTSGMPVEARVHELFAQLGWFGCYSVFRSRALRKTRLYRPTYGGDVCMLLELALLGQSLVLPGKLFHYRTPDAPKTTLEYFVAIDPNREAAENPEEIERPLGSLTRSLLAVIRESQLDGATAQRIEQDVVDTLVLDNTAWGDILLDERGLPHVEAMSVETAKEAVGSVLGLNDSPELSKTSDLTRYAWSVADGMRLHALRRALLRLLKPFTDRQNALDMRASRAIELLNYELKWMRYRVHALEHRVDRDGGAHAHRSENDPCARARREDEARFDRDQDR